MSDVTILGKLTNEEIDILIHHHAVNKARWSRDENPKAHNKADLSGKYWKLVKAVPSLETWAQTP